MPNGDDSQGFVERMFPAPTDHGIAEEDRAVSSVKSGTDTPPQEAGNTRWYEGEAASGSGLTATSSCIHRPGGW